MDWSLMIILFTEKNLNISLKISMSNFFLQIKIKDTGRWFVVFSCYSFVWMGTMLPFFSSEGHIPFRKVCLKMTCNSVPIKLLYIFSMQIPKPLCLWALTKLRFLTFFPIFLAENVYDIRRKWIIYLKLRGHEMGFYTIGISFKYVADFISKLIYAQTALS